MHVMCLLWPYGMDVSRRPVREQGYRTASRECEVFVDPFPDQRLFGEAWARLTTGPRGGGKETTCDCGLGSGHQRSAAK